MFRFGTKYKEVLFGLSFGLGASLIDVAMHSGMSDTDFLAELIHPTLVMAAYRFLFLVFGSSLGLLLWLRNRRERAFRDLSLSLNELRKNVTGPSIVVHTCLQVLLTEYRDGISVDALEAIQSAYEHSAVIQRALTSTQDR